jgi:hypothetical protein
MRANDLERELSNAEACVSSRVDASSRSLMSDCLRLDGSNERLPLETMESSLNWNPAHCV